jgi:cellulose synthase/poly-beta-1,6-N-acetylglucosamine synthase-like glycosyltransferase
MTVFSLVMIFQGIFTLWWMLYAWNHPEKVKENQSPKTFSQPILSFSAIIPAKQEQNVIAQTITALSAIDYPETLKEIIIVCRYDDTHTIKKAEETIMQLGKHNIKLVLFNDEPINKPHALNIGLQHASHDIVVVFDAEDEPHKDIFHIANTIMQKENIDVLQSGVQLMNYRSTWFSTLNVLEYFFWFKSTLQFFASVGIIPLGGNTVFFRKDILETIGGWNEKSLTEDAEIGIRLSVEGAKMRIVYDEKHVTQEESPLSLTAFIKQRTRWSQGFIQIFFKGDWIHLEKMKQKFLAGYILISSELQAFLFLYALSSYTIITYINLPVWIVILLILPFYILLLQLLLYCIGLYIFSKNYHKKFYFWLPLKIFITFLPFQLILGYSAFRGTIRFITRNYHWEKTEHVNAHRMLPLKLTIETI